MMPLAAVGFVLFVILFFARHRNVLLLSGAGDKLYQESPCRNCRRGVRDSYKNTDRKEPVVYFLKE